MSINPVEYPVLDVIANRRSPYRFLAQEVEQEKILCCLEAARWAASCFNAQPWSWILARRQDSEAFGRMVGCLMEANQPWAANAGALLLSVTRPTFEYNGKPNRMALHDLGRSNESRLLIDDFISLADGNAHWGVARLYAWTGNADAAFDALDRAATGMQRWVEGRQVRWNLQGIARAARDPVFQRLHEDARWQDFILRNGIAEQQLEDIGLTLEAALLVDDAR